MKKNIVVLSLIILLPVPLQGMDWGDVPPCGLGIDQPSEYLLAVQEKRQSLALDEGRDPNGYGPLNIPTQITDKDREDAKDFISQINQENYWRYEGAYAELRHKTARALLCGEYDHKVACAAMEKNDLFIWQLLIQNRDSIKKTHGIDVASNPILGTPPLRIAKSLEMAKLLIEKGFVSIKDLEDDSCTQIHRACHPDFATNILDYYLDKDPAAIHKIKQGNTPLIALGENILQYPKYLIAAHEKIAVLKKYGANFHYKSTDKSFSNQTALDIVCEAVRRYGNFSFQVRSQLANLATILSTAMQEQCVAKITESKTQECTVCLELLDKDVQMLDCLHVLHERCILRSIHAGHKKCPICRAETLPKDKSYDHDSDGDDSVLRQAQDVRDDEDDSDDSSLGFGLFEE